MELMKTKNKRLSGILLFMLALSLIPLVAMQFTTEVKWELNDFIIAATLLLGSGLLAEIILRKVISPKRRMGFLIGLIVVVLLIWAELAVGIFGTPLAGN